LKKIEESIQNRIEKQTVGNLIAELTREFKAVNVLIKQRIAEIG
jgi:hypothetical protein